MGAGNSAINQGFNNGWQNIDWGQVAMSGVLGGATSYLGGQLGDMLANPISNLTSDIASPVLREVITQGATNSATGFALGAGLAWGTGASFEEGLKQGRQGALLGAGIGIMTGTVAGFKYARDHKVSPRTGKSYAAKGREDFTYTKSAGRHLTDVVKQGENKGQLARPI